MPNKPSYNPVNLPSPTDHCSVVELDLQEIRVEMLQTGSESSGTVRHSSPVVTELHVGKGTAQKQTFRPGGGCITVLVWES